MTAIEHPAHDHTDWWCRDSALPRADRPDAGYCRPCRESAHRSSGRTEGELAALTALLVALVDPDRPGGPVDFGDVLAAALTQAADRLGGVEQLVAGRPGSWEADHVRCLAGHPSY